MNLELGDRWVWDGVAFELIAYDAASARLRAVDEGYVRVVLMNELQRDPSIEWPKRELRQVRTFDPQSLKALPLPQQAKIQLWLPHVTRLDQFLSSARRDADETNRVIAEIAHSIGKQTPAGSVDPAHCLAETPGIPRLRCAGADRQALPVYCPEESRPSPPRDRRRCVSPSR